MEICRMFITVYGALCAVASVYHMYRNRKDKDQVIVCGLTLLLGILPVIGGILYGEDI